MRCAGTNNDWLAMLAHYGVCTRGSGILGAPICRRSGTGILYFIVTTVPRILQEILREELSILVEVIPGTLYKPPAVIQVCISGKKRGTHIGSQDMHGSLLSKLLE
jgi:hypothetical protein